MGRAVASREYLVASRELSREETLVVGIECDHRAEGRNQLGA